MGGIMSTIEFILTGGLLTQQITSAILRSKIKNLLEKHRGQFQLMTELHQFIEKVLQKSLRSQINVGIMFAADNWITISEDLEDKNQLLKKILEQYSKVKVENLDFTWKTGLMIGVAAAFFGFFGYQFIFGETRPQLFKDLKSLKNFVKAGYNRIRGIAPQLEIAKINQEGIINVDEFGNLTFGEIQSNVEVAQECAKKKILKTIGAYGFRALMIIVMILAFVNGVIEIGQLRKHLSQCQQYFKEKGDFEKAEEDLLRLMSLGAADIFNLANCSRAALFDVKNMFYVKSIITPSTQETTLAYARELTPEKFGLTSQFISNSKRLIDSSNNALKSSESRKIRLNEMAQGYRQFFRNNNPQDIFINIATTLSKAVGYYSVIDKNVAKEQRTVLRFLDYVADIVSKKRGPNFDQKSAQEKNAIDTEILQSSFSKYKSAFDLDDVEISKISQKTKTAIFRIIISFVNSFYYDDPTGRKLFGLDIEKQKSKETYQSIMNKQFSGSNIIPVYKDKPQDEKKEAQIWLSMAIEQNKKSDYKYWDKDRKPQSLYRYIRIYLQKYKDSKNVERQRLSGSEGLCLKVTGVGIFVLEKTEVDGIITLTKATAMVD